MFRFLRRNNPNQKARNRRRPAATLSGTALVLLGFLMLLWIALVQTTTGEITGTLQVHFLDVGQADAIVIQTPEGQTMLVDGGNAGDAKYIIDYLKKLGVERIDHLVATHPHEDHIGGLRRVVETFPIGKVYMPRVVHTTATYENLLLAIAEKNLRITPARAGLVIEVDPELEVEFLAPVGEDYRSLNDYSAVLLLTHGEVRFLLTGDAETTSESEMLASGRPLQADVLKVAHHGSNSSTSPSFLEAVRPRHAVISVGAGNRYNHPSELILQRLAQAGVRIWRTDQHGTIVATSDGTTVTVKAEKN